MIILDSICNLFNLSYHFGLIDTATRYVIHILQSYDWRSAIEAVLKHMGKYINPKNWSYEREEKDKNILVSEIYLGNNCITFQFQSNVHDRKRYLPH